MIKTKVPVYVIVLLILGTIVCSWLSGVFVIPAIAFYSALFIISPSWLVAIPLAADALLALIFNNGNYELTFIMTLAYAIPAMFIAVSALKRLPKFFIVLNGAIGMFLYSVAGVVVMLFRQYGGFGREIMNNAIDAQISAVMGEITNAFASVPAETSQPLIETMEKALYIAKPLLPAILFSTSFSFVYVSVCIVNFILKRLSVVNNVPYRLVPPMALSILYLLSFIVSMFIPADSFAAVVFSSITLILAPMLLISGVGVTFTTISNLLKNRIIPVIIIVVLIVFFQPFTYSLFCLAGCYYSIITGIKNRGLKGGK